MSCCPQAVLLLHVSSSTHCNACVCEARCHTFTLMGFTLVLISVCFGQYYLKCPMMLDDEAKRQIIFNYRVPQKHKVDVSDVLLLFILAKLGHVYLELNFRMNTSSSRMDCCHIETTIF